MIKLVNSKIGKVTVSIKKIAWLYLIMIPTFFIDFSIIQLSTVVLTLSLTLLTVCLGHSIGLHRGIIHKSYVTSKWFRNLSLYLFTLSGLGSPLSWLKIHYYRDYWQNRLDCPPYFAYEHSLIKDYWWNLHLQFRTNDNSRYNIPVSDLNDSWISFLHKTWVLHNVLLMLLVFIIFDTNTMLIAVFLRILLTILGHWYIGYASHKYGYSRFNIEHANESAYNDVFLGFISFGEGFHNNHHAHPSSAKFSLAWYEFDLGWQFVKLLRWLNVIWNVKEANMDLTLKTTAKLNSTISKKFPWQ